MYNILPYFIVFIATFYLYKLFFSRFTIFSLSRQKNYLSNSKYAQLDGLRGILAISVIFHHSIIMYNYFIKDLWEVPPSVFYTLLGQVSVAIFFIITGFLFGFKIFTNKFKIKNFFISRIRRIIPLQIFSVILVFLIIFYLDDFLLKVSPLELIKEFIYWILYTKVTINENEYSNVIETVYWTLKYEWKFYILLPIIYIVNRKLKNKYILLIILFTLTIVYNIPYIPFFFVGLFISLLIQKEIVFKSNILNILAILATLAIFVFFDTAYNIYVAMLLAILFYAIISSQLFFKVLTNEILTVFGHVSYSLYLLHNIIIFIIFYNINHYYKKIIDLSIIEYWIAVFLIVNITLLISIQTYKYIEYKFYFNKK